MAPKTSMNGNVSHIIELETSILKHSDNIKKCIRYLS